jgi:hypothetical protein
MKLGARGVLPGLTGRAKSKRFPEVAEASMNPRTEIVETRVYRRGRNRDVLCRLIYEVTPYREGLFRWFLVGIEELE